MIDALAAAFLAILFLPPLALLVFGLVLWIDLFAAAWSSRDSALRWSIDMRLTGFAAVVFTAIGLWGCAAAVSAIGSALA